MEKRYNLWENAEHVAFLWIDYSDPFSISRLGGLISNQFESAGGTELADLLYIIHGTETLATDRIVPGSYSDDVNTWLTELSDRHRGLMDLPDAGCGDKFQGPGFIEDFMVLLDEIRAYYRRIYPFKTMFYDFIQNSGKKEYRAALALLKMLYEENKEEGKVIEYAREEWDSVSKNVTQNIARLRLKRYLSVMANVKLRKKYFNF